MSNVDFSDVQGLIRYGYGKMTRASYTLVRIKNPAAARAWLRAAPVSNAEERNPPPDSALHVAFTPAGLETLGLPSEVIAGFSHEFQSGMADKNRARQLGDTGENAPTWWSWGSTPDNEPHAVVMFFAIPARFDAAWQSLRNADWSAAFEVLPTPDLAPLQDFEPFGFADGISQPKVDWDQQRPTTHAQYEYSNIAALGEFLLGYPNEYGKFTERPLLAAHASTSELLPALDDPSMKDLGRNGTYLVVRQLSQDVRGFWNFVRETAKNDPKKAKDLSEKMVGRTHEGTPLATSKTPPIPGVGPKEEELRQNNFTFDADPNGSRCPFGSHIRRVNPRNADFPAPPTSLFQKLLTMLGFGPNRFRDDLMSSVRFHRIIRRGRSYGDVLDPANFPTEPPPANGPRGLYFVCLNANISRQFEFLQNAWIANTKFSGLTAESDPLLGNRQPIPGCPATDSFTIQRENGLPHRVTGLPQFVTVRGGAYFFLPSLRALRYIAAEPPTKS